MSCVILFTSKGDGCLRAVFIRSSHSSGVPTVCLFFNLPIKANLGHLAGKSDRIENTYFIDLNKRNT